MRKTDRIPDANPFSVSVIRAVVCCILLTLPAAARVQAASREVSVPMCGRYDHFHFTVPRGWKWGDGQLVEEGPPHQSIYIGCYLPPHGGSYRDFHQRIAEQLETTRKEHGPARVRHFQLGGLAAVEIRSLHRKQPDSELVQTFIDVPIYRNLRQLFMVVYSADHHHAGVAQTYRDLLRSCRVTRGDD